MSHCTGGAQFVMIRLHGSRTCQICLDEKISVKQLCILPCAEAILALTSPPSRA